MPDVTMPRLSDSMEEATIIRWLKADGDSVSKGDELVEIETDKATVVYEAEEEGELAIVAAEGDTVPFGGIIARIGKGGTPAAPVATPSVKTRASAAAGGGSSAAAVWVAPPARPRQGQLRVPSSPVARRVAERLGIDLATLTGTGVQGRVTKADVEAAASRGGALQAADRAEPSPIESSNDGRSEPEVRRLSRIQQVIARRMSESSATVPDFAVTIDIDMEAANEARNELRRLTPAGERTPSYNDFIVRACALALRRHPRANGSYRDGQFELHDRINIGIAVAAQEALLVPVVHDADRKGLAKIASETLSLAERARDGVATPADLSGATFTVSNLGMFGVASFTAVVNAPQAAILAVGAVTPRAVVRDSQVVIRETASMTLSSDHRILYGADAASFLATVRALLEAPLSMLL
jgi:pyruvate dehydrogenase E2 component (dihydrolipoamide acetyltransferase)